MLTAYGKLELNTRQKRMIREAFLDAVVDKDIRIIDKEDGNKINRVKILDFERDCKQIKRINKYRGITNYYLKYCKGGLIVYTENAEPLLRYDFEAGQFKFIFGELKAFYAWE